MNTIIDFFVSIEFLTNFLANVSAGILVGMVFYIIIDARLAKKRRKRANYVVFVLLKDCLHELDKAKKWVEELPIDEIVHGKPTLPSLRKEVWENKRRDIGSDIEIDYLLHLDTHFQSLSSVHRIFEVIAKVQPPLRPDNDFKKQIVFNVGAVYERNSITLQKHIERMKLKVTIAQLIEDRLNAEQETLKLVKSMNT